MRDVHHFTLRRAVRRFMTGRGLLTQLLVVCMQPSTSRWELPMKKRAQFPTLALVAAAFLTASTFATAQSTGRLLRGGGERPVFPTLPPQAGAPPLPAGLNGNLPPGFGGPLPTPPNGSGAGNPPIPPADAPGLFSVCGPGGALSGEAVQGQVGRSRARALVCPGG